MKRECFSGDHDRTKTYPFCRSGVGRGLTVVGIAAAVALSLNVGRQRPSLSPSLNLSVSLYCYAGAGGFPIILSLSDVCMELTASRDQLPYHRPPPSSRRPLIR